MSLAALPYPPAETAVNLQAERKAIECELGKINEYDRPDIGDRLWRATARGGDQ